MIGLFPRGFLTLALVGLSASLTQTGGFAQTNAAKTPLPLFHLPISLEWHGSLDPHSRDKLATEGFKLQGGTKNLKMKFSTQAPGILGGKQFQWMPGGYQISEFSLSRKWGSIQGFRSLRSVSRIVPAEYARTISGAGVELPKTPLGTRLSAYFLHAAPARGARVSLVNRLAGSPGSQIGITLARDLKKIARLQAEWTQSQHDFRPSSEVKAGESPGGARHGLMMKFEGNPARIDLHCTFLARDQGLANPAAPAFAPGKRTFRLDARRKVKGHQFQYSAQSDLQMASPFWGFPASDLGEHIASWSYASKRLPQISISHTWRKQATAGRQEAEQGYRLSVARSIRRINASLTLFRTERFGIHLTGPFWQHTGISGDAVIEIRKRHQLHARYEASMMRQPIIQQEADISSLRLDTRVDLWGEKLLLIPAFDLRRQGGSLPSSDQAAARFGLSAQIKSPRWIPGTDFVVNLTTNHLRSAGRPAWNRADLTVHWNFKRF